MARRGRGHQAAHQQAGPGTRPAHCRTSSVTSSPRKCVVPAGRETGTPQCTGDRSGLPGVQRQVGRCAQEPDALVPRSGPLDRVGVEGHAAVEGQRIDTPRGRGRDRMRGSLRAGSLGHVPLDRYALVGREDQHAVAGPGLVGNEGHRRTEVLGSPLGVPLSERRPPTRPRRSRAAAPRGPPRRGGPGKRGGRSPARPTTPPREDSPSGSAPRGAVVDQRQHHHGGHGHDEPARGEAQPAIAGRTPPRRPGAVAPARRSPRPRRPQPGRGDPTRRAERRPGSG